MGSLGSMRVSWLVSDECRFFNVFVDLRELYYLDGQTGVPILSSGANKIC